MRIRIRPTGRQLLVTLAVIGVLAFASYVTRCNWDGGYPSTETRVTVRDEAGEPVRGAVLLVFRKGTREPAFGYPIDNHLPDNALVSNEQGLIVARHVSRGLEFGGEAWWLFWIIPMGTQHGPEFDGVFAARGFQPVEIDLWRLWDSPCKSWEDFPKVTVVVNGQAFELPIREQTIVLRRK